MSRFQATGENSKAPFTLKVHRGDGMALLAMNWRNGMPPRNFVGFAIEFREPGSDEFWPVLNSLGFPGQRKTFSDPPIESTKAPIQKFRWVHFPGNAEKKGEFTYRVTPMLHGQAGHAEPRRAPDCGHRPDARDDSRQAQCRLHPRLRLVAGIRPKVRARCEALDAAAGRQQEGAGVQAHAQERRQRRTRGWDSKAVGDLRAAGPGHQEEGPGAGHRLRPQPSRDSSRASRS